MNTAVGVQVGSAGKERVGADRQQTEKIARAALAMLPPEVARQLQEETGEIKRTGAVTPRSSLARLTL